MLIGVKSKSVVIDRSQFFSAGYRRAKDFMRDESGTTTLLTLYIFIIMLLMAGLGLDTMRHEMERSKLQSVTDTAVLAAAKAEDDAEAKLVIESYFDKNGKLASLREVKKGDIKITQNSAKVAAAADVEVKTYLMKLAGVDKLSAGSSATAITNTPKIEISLVLDVSGSMGNNNKLENLQDAAKKFVATVINSSEPGDTAIAIVPFSTSVNPTTVMRDALHFSQTHDYSNCLEFRETDYDTVVLPTTSAAQSNPALDPVRQAIFTSRKGGFDDLNYVRRSCYNDAHYTVMPFSNDVKKLQDKIDTFQANGWTTGSLGIKWGAGMLDPSFRAVTPALIAAGEMDAVLADVPRSYNDPDTQKIIVMMSDGKNTPTHFFLENSAYRGAGSDFYEIRYQNEVRYFLRDPSSNSINGANTAANPAATGTPCTVQNLDGSWGPNGCDDIVDRGEMDDWNYIDLETGAVMDGSDFVEFPDTKADFKFRRQHTWEIAWGRFSPKEYGELTGEWDAFDEYEVGAGLVNGSKKDDRMGRACGATRQKGVVVYTIGFEITDGGPASIALKDCASSENYYFPTDGQGISQVFSTIAGNVQALRLTQ